MVRYSVFPAPYSPKGGELLSSANTKAAFSPCAIHSDLRGVAQDKLPHLWFPGACTTNHPGRKEDILKIHCVLPFAYQTVKTMDPERWEFPQESQADKRKRLKPGGAFVSQEEILHSCDRLSDHLEVHTGTQTVMD